MKTVRFKDASYVGDPINVIKIFNEKGVDELFLIDIRAAKTGAPPDFAFLETIAGECFMPLGYGGGVRTVQDAERLFSLGIEKVALQSAVSDDPRLVTELARRYGSQSVVCSVDIKKNIFGKKHAYIAKNSSPVKKDWRSYLKELVDAGAGEILLNSVDLDGTREGYDLELIAEAAALVSVPLIALGGAGSVADLERAFASGASAAAAGSLFVYQGPLRAVLIKYLKVSDHERLTGLCP